MILEFAIVGRAASSWLVRFHFHLHWKKRPTINLSEVNNGGNPAICRKILGKPSVR